MGRLASLSANLATFVEPIPGVSCKGCMGFVTTARRFGYPENFLVLHTAVGPREGRL